MVTGCAVEDAAETRFAATEGLGPKQSLDLGGADLAGGKGVGDLIRYDVDIFTSSPGSSSKVASHSQNVASSRVRAVLQTEGTDAPDHIGVELVFDLGVSDTRIEERQSVKVSHVRPYDFDRCVNDRACVGPWS